MNLKSVIIALLCCLLSALCRADTFVVTNYNDTGVGTLREALTLAAANGNAVVDNIFFNLPAGLQTIVLYSPLPAITSSIIIDGTTQPGAAVALNGAKIGISPAPSYTSNPIAFEVHDAADVEIYGMIIDGFFSINSQGHLTGGDGIAFLGKCDRAIIGAPGKGNVLFNNGNDIYDGPPSYGQPNPVIAYCQIQSNYIGMNATGTFDFSFDVGNSVVLSYTQQALVGGTTAAQGNVIYGDFTFSPYLDGAVGTFTNNIFGASIKYTAPADFTSVDTQIYLTSNIVNPALPLVINFSSNVVGTVLSASSMSNLTLNVQSNIFGQSPDGTLKLPIQGPAIDLSDLTGTVLIGGSDVSLGNKITQSVVNATSQNNKDGIIQALNVNKVELSHNSIFCNNDRSFIYLRTAQADKPVFVNLNDYTASGASGTTKPNARVELFYTDNGCTHCEPQTYVGSTVADGAGNWVYNGALVATNGLIVGATLNGVSSEFSDPILDETKVTTAPTTCTTGGSVTGMTIINGAQVRWFDGAGNVIGTQLDLTNVPGGSYYMVGNQFGCQIKSKTYVVLDQTPKIKGYPNYTATACGASNGGVANLQPGNYTSLQWLDASGKQISQTADLTGVPTGVYTLRLYGVNCYNDFGPYTVPSSQDVITISTTSAQINNDQCGLNEGSVKNVTVSGGNTPYKYNWTNSSGQLMSTAADLNGVSAGTYTLNVTDTGCGIASQTFTITNDTSIIAPPAISNFKICGTEAYIRVANVENGYRYKLYSDNLGTTPLQQNTTGIFLVTINAARSFYLTKSVGTCESTRAEVDITIGYDSLVIPNAFTPNGDGINDYWQINGLNVYAQAKIDVFNRYGQLIYNSTGYSIPWDGTFKGKPVPGGTYYYIISLGNSDACKLMSGSIAVIR